MSMRNPTIQAQACVDRARFTSQHEQSHIQVSSSSSESVFSVDLPRRILSTVSEISVSVSVLALAELES